MTHVAITALACLLSFPAAAGTAATNDVAVADAIASRFPWLLSPRTLHDASFRFPDGVKGASSLVPIAQRVLPDPPRAGLSDDAHLGWASYCASNAIVHATSVDSVGVITTAKDAIFTRSTFHVDDVIKGTASIVPGANLTTMRPGGEVVDAGERLRVMVGGIDTPIVGHHYVLELRSLARDGFADRFLYRATDTDDLDAPLRTDFGFGRASYAELKRGLLQSSTIAPCPALRT